MPLLTCLMPPEAADVTRRQEKEKQFIVPKLDPDCLVTAGQEGQSYELE